MSVRTARTIDDPADDPGDDAAGESQTSELHDGRRQRRERNREAVVAALLELYHEGNLDPSSAEIADRAGLSPRSLFRYFDDVDDLCQAAIAAQQQQVLPLTRIDATPSEPFEQRLAAFVSQRLAVFAAMGAAGTVSRLRAPFQPVVAHELRQSRAFLRSQLARLFANELGALPATRAAAALAAADVICSFDAYRLLVDDQGLDRATTEATITQAVRALLAPDPERTSR
jgi:AcrR family transcriptional regulator